MKNSHYQWIGLCAWFALVAAGVVACGGGGGSSPMTPQDGTLRMAITDAPACGYDHVWVSVDKVRVNTNANAQDGDSGWTDLTLSPSRRIDLLALTNGVLEELGSVPLPAGHYSQVRLVLTPNPGGSSTPPNAVQPTGGAVTALATPSGQQSGVKLLANFDVAAGQMADMVLDFDACSSVVKAGNSGQYVLKPVVTVVPRTVTAITGSVTTTLTLSSTTVSAQQDGATVRATTPDAAGNFSIPFLAPGTYTLVITSDAHATGVVTSVPAGSTTTVVSPTPIVLPSSSMATVSGSVLSGTTPVTDATIRATQSLSGGPSIEVARQGVDATAATFQLHLPQAAPVKAGYSGGALTFTPDASVAGKYSVESSATGRATMTKPADVGTATTATLTFTY
jgi:hypothetical protein